MSRLIIAAEIGYKDVSVSPNTTSTLYVASEGFVTAHTDTLVSKYFAGRLNGDVSYKIQIATQFWRRKSSIGIGSIEIVNDDGDLDAWLDYEFRDQAVVIKLQTAGASYDTATVMLNAVVERLDVINERRFRLIIRDPASAMLSPMTTAVYDNTTDAEGTLVPIAYGEPKLCKPVLVSDANLEYHIHDAAVLSVDKVYDQGTEIDYAPVTKGFRLTVPPTGKVTANPITSGTGDATTLTLSPAEYVVTGEGRTLNMFLDSLSPRASLKYGFSNVNYVRASSSGGQWYFEMYINELDVPRQPAELSQQFGTDTGEVAIGISNAAVSNPQSPKSSGFYCMALGQFADLGTTFVKHTAYNDNAVSDTYDTSSSTYAPARGNTIGVKVDFDSSPMTVEFLHNNIAPDAAFGPWGIVAGSYSPVLGVVHVITQGTQDKCSIRLSSADQTYDPPLGFTSWSEGITPDTDFQLFIDSITDRVAVTFDTTSVTAMAALSTGSPEVAYKYGYYLDKTTTAAAVLTEAMSGIGGYWYVNRTGDIELGQLTAPAASVLTLDDSELLDVISLKPDHAPGLSDGVGSAKNWSPYAESVVSGAVGQIFKQKISRPFQNEYRSTTAMANTYDHAIGAAFPPSLLTVAIDASTECDRFASLYAVERNFWKVTIALSGGQFDNLLDDIGNTITIDTARFGLSGGKDLVLIGVEGAFLKNEISLTLWG